MMKNNSMTQEEMSKEHTLHQRAELYMYARLSGAKNDLRDAENWDGRGWAGVEHWEDVYNNQIEHCKRRMEIIRYILNKLNEQRGNE